MSRPAPQGLAVPHRHVALPVERSRDAATPRPLGRRPSGVSELSRVWWVRRWRARHDAGVISTLAEQASAPAAAPPLRVSVARALGPRDDVRVASAALPGVEDPRPRALDANAHGVPSALRSATAPLATARWFRGRRISRTAQLVVDSSRGDTRDSMPQNMVPRRTLLVRPTRAGR